MPAWLSLPPSQLHPDHTTPNKPRRRTRDQHEHAACRRERERERGDYKPALHITAAVLGTNLVRDSLHPIPLPPRPSKPNNFPPSQPPKQTHYSNPNTSSHEIKHTLRWQTQQTRKASREKSTSCWRDTWVCSINTPRSAISSPPSKHLWVFYHHHSSPTWLLYCTKTN